MLDSLSSKDKGPIKQLAESCTSYDMFRAALGLPVVPNGCQWYVVNRGKKRIRPSRFFDELRFPESMEVIHVDLLTNTSAQVLSTKVDIEFGKYYHPRNANHPWIDRLVVAENQITKERCLVIYRDTVTESSFVETCQNLDKAASLFSKSNGIAAVLLVMNVLDDGIQVPSWLSLHWPLEASSTEESSLPDLNWPYLLVRPEELSLYYTKHFDHLFESARNRCASIPSP